MSSLIDMVVDLTANPGFQRARLPMVSRPLALILLGGLLELTALIVEDGRNIHELTEPAVTAATALLGRPASNEDEPR
jgi:hypothetical protein